MEGETLRMKTTCLTTVFIFMQNYKCRSFQTRMDRTSGSNMRLVWCDSKRTACDDITRWFGIRVVRQFTADITKHLYMCCEWPLVIRSHLRALYANKHVHRFCLQRPNASSFSTSGQTDKMFLQHRQEASVPKIQQEAAANTWAQVMEGSSHY